MCKAAISYLAFFVAAGIILTSACSGNPNATITGPTTGATGGGTVGSTTGTVTDNPQNIVAWSAIQGRTNVAATMRVCDSDTTVTQIPAEIFSASIQTVNLSGRVETGVQDLSCQPGNNRGVYEGDSGSPVLINGSIAGGLFGSSNGKTFDARGIQQEEGTQSGPPAALAAGPRRTPQWHMEGDPSVFTLLKTKPGFQNAIYEGAVRNAGRAPQAQNVPPIPGLRFASPFVIGPYVVGFDAATFTIQRSDGLWLGTAHGLEDAGTVSWPIMGFSVTGFSGGAVNGQVFGSIYGTLKYDGQNGSLIDASTAAAMMPVTVNMSLNAIPRPSVIHQVRFDKGSATENQGIEVAVQATFEALVTDSGPFSGNGTVHLTTSGPPATRSLTFSPNESESAFASSISSQIDQVLRAQHTAYPTLQIKSVVVDLTVTG